MKGLGNRLGWAGTLSLVVIALFVALAILAPLVAPYPAQGAGAPNIAAKFRPPSAEFWLGADHLGRDMLSRVIYGARVSLATGFLIVAFALGIGLPVGLAAGYFGGWLDEALMRVTDIFLAFPALLLAVLMAAALGAGLVNSIVAVAVTWWPWYARLARAEVLVLRGQPYVEAARLMGVSHATIIARHILPAAGRPLGVQAALDVGPALLTASALSFLGLGILPPTADWGQMVNAGRAFFPERWWYAAVPGLSIFVLALAFSVLGDALREGQEGGAMALLEIAGLSVAFGGPGRPVQAVRHVDLLIPRGAIHGLIGESGCGKTVTGLAMLGLLPPSTTVTAEAFRFDGLDLNEVAASLRGRRIAMISQDPAAALNPVLTIGRQMDDVLRAHTGQPRHRRRAAAEELLAATGLPDPAGVLKSYPHQLSGGMQQRVVIAQALATGADFLIADEPTTALDVTVGAQVLALLKRLVAERGLTVLMITHDMDVVAEVCDRATVLYAGLTVEEGLTADLLARPRHPYTQALLAALPDAAGKGQRLAAIEGRIPPPTEAITGCAFAPRCPKVMPVCAITTPPVRGDATRRWLCHLGTTGNG